MAAGLRERKKQKTREEIFEAARELFDKRGFESVTVAEVARAADVSQVTVFNYFPTKEDLFYAGMQFFEEQLLEAVRSRPPGEPAIKAFRRRVVEGAENLGARQRAETIVRSGRIIASSPSLVAREREIVERFTERLAELLAAETRSKPDDVEPLAAAAAMMGTHRALVAYTRRRVLAGHRGTSLVDDFRTQARRAFARIEKGLEGYAVR